MRLTAAALVLAIVAALPAAAQEHAHATGPVAIAHDLRADGATYAGGLSGFAPLFLGDDAVPDPHRQNHVRVTQGGTTLFETTADSGHDYDGIAPFLLALPAAGPYEVAVLDGAKVQASFAGVAAPAPSGPAVAAVLEAPGQVAAGAPATFTLAARDPAGLVPHTDGIVEVRRGGPDGEVMLRVHTHTHEAPMQLQYTFLQPGTYAVRATVYQAYPGGGEGDFAPATTVHDLTVGPGLPAPALPAAAAPPASRNAVVEGTASGGPYRLLGTYDPYTHVGLGTLQHLAALVMDPATRMPVAHVDFEAELSGPAGTWWSSSSLHEYDGILEVAAQAPLPGIHVLTVRASHGAWSGSLELPFHVAPAADLAPQAASVSMQAPRLQAGVPAQLVLTARDAAGRPLAHSEVDLVVLGPDGVPHLTAKLHTHASGDFPFTLTLPREGTYRFLASASSLEPSTPAAGAASFSLGVEPAPIVEGLPGSAPAAAAAAPIPGIAAALGVLAAAWARRRA